MGKVDIAAPWTWAKAWKVLSLARALTEPRTGGSQRRTCMCGWQWTELATSLWVALEALLAQEQVLQR